MRRTVILFILILTISNNRLAAHSGKPQYYVIIDTDCAIDDLRAITMLLASSKLAVLGITTSDGTLDPYDGCTKVESLLKHFHHEGIPVAAGQRVLENPPGWRDMNRNILWGDEEAPAGNCSSLSAVDFIVETIGNEQNRVTMICLGSLTNIAQALQGESNIKQQIERIIWFNGTPGIINGTNYKFDIQSADYILNSGINIDIISNSSNGKLLIDSLLMDSISNLNSVYAKEITSVHQQKELQSSSHKGYLNMWDDLVPVYLTSPMAFTIDSTSENDNVRIVAPFDLSRIRTLVIDILDVNKYVSSIMFKGFPDDPELFRDDVAEVMHEIIGKYGLEEWKLGVLTNELHGHLGIYAIVGVKMGLRAREFFNIGIDDIKVISYAGRKTPLSCMNDGLQVSTGGTLGHGLIFLADNDKTMPMAVFSYMDRTVIIKLKDEYVNIARNDIKNCISEYGDLTNNYWNCVRRHAIEYWLEWDKHDMFEIEY